MISSESSSEDGGDQLPQCRDRMLSTPLSVEHGDKVESTGSPLVETPTLRTVFRLLHPISLILHRPTIKWFANKATDSPVEKALKVSLSTLGNETIATCCAIALFK